MPENILNMYYIRDWDECIFQFLIGKSVQYCEKYIQKAGLGDLNYKWNTDLLSSAIYSMTK